MGIFSVIPQAPVSDGYPLRVRGRLDKRSADLDGCVSDPYAKDKKGAAARLSMHGAASKIARQLNIEGRYVLGVFSMLALLCSLVLPQEWDSCGYRRRWTMIGQRQQFFPLCWNG